MEEYKTILKKTDGGLDIFSYYLGKECLKKKFKSPFRSGDNRPSCHLYLNELMEVVHMPDINFRKIH